MFFVVQEVNTQLFCIKNPVLPTYPPKIYETLTCISSYGKYLAEFK